MNTSLEQLFALSKSQFEWSYSVLGFFLRWHKIPFPPWFGTSGLLKHYPISSFSDFSKQEIEDLWHCSTKGNLEIQGGMALFLPSLYQNLSLDEGTIRSADWSLCRPGATDSSNIPPLIKPGWGGEKLPDQRERERGCSSCERFRAHKAVIIV